MLRLSRRAFTSLALLLGFGCSESDSSSKSQPSPDGGTPDGGTPDGGAPDGGTPDGGTPLPPITLHPKDTGVAPYMATVFPLEGAVPEGSTVVSDDDPTLRGAVLSRWPDGSASVVVVAGEMSLTAGTPKKLTLRAGLPTGDPLAPSLVGEVVTSVSVDCGALGTASVTGFGSPERTWWSSPSVICCRYRAPVGSDPTLEAVIDIHVFASKRAFVEVVLENGKVDAAADSPAKPTTKAYAANVSVNGGAVATISSPAIDQPYASGKGGGTYAGDHEAFRAWYVSSWVGGDPGVEVTHEAAALQAHPLFFRCWKPAAGDFADTYGGAAYEPWSAGLLNVPGMPGSGDIEGIGPFTQWDSRYLQTGSKFVRRAVIASALGALSCNVSYRDGASGRVPTLAQTEGNNQDDGTWPGTTTEPAWELAHHPAVGLMAFLCRPSPVFIELAQKIAVWNATCSFSDGVFGFWAQVRGKAWGIRSLAHAIFLTPDGDPWKSPAKASLHANAKLLDSFRKSPNAVLGFVWHASPTTCGDFEDKNKGMQQPLWMHHMLLTSLHAAESSKLLAGAEQALLTEVTDWAALQPARYVNEATKGEWRLHNYLTTVGRRAVGPADDNLGSGIYAGPDFDPLPTYPENLAWYYEDEPPASTGKFLFIGTDPVANPSYLYWSSASESNSAGVSYAALFWAALVVATERGVPGAFAAWDKVVAGINNLEEWAASFADEPRYNRYPRNK